jgi:hypothetical protein
MPCATLGGLLKHDSAFFRNDGAKVNRAVQCDVVSYQRSTEMPLGGQKKIRTQLCGVKSVLVM